MYMCLSPLVVMAEVLCPLAKCPWREVHGAVTGCSDEWSVGLLSDRRHLICIGVPDVVTWALSIWWGMELYHQDSVDGEVVLAISN